MVVPTSGDGRRLADEETDLVADKTDPDAGEAPGTEVEADVDDDAGAEADAGQTPDGVDDDDEDRSAGERLRELGGYIKEQRSRAQYSLRHLARIAGVSNPYLSQIERGLRKPSAEILQAIAKALQISSETLYVKAGLLDEPSEMPDLEVAILHEDSLTERQRAALIEVYRSFRLENDQTGDGDDEDDDPGGDGARDGDDPGPGDDEEPHGGPPVGGRESATG